MTSTVKLNGVNLNVIELQLFLFSLRYIIENWFESLPYESIENREELVEAFIERFFPLPLTSERRREIITFN